MKLNAKYNTTEIGTKFIAPNYGLEYALRF